MIVKNEAENLPRALAALHGLVDEIAIYDTGSTDNTVAIAREHGARVQEGYWDDDFGRARNAALQLATAEWALVVDADDEVFCSIPGQLRRYLSGDGRALVDAPFPSRLDYVYMRVVNYAGDRAVDSLESIRIARRDSVRWVGRLHEQLEPADPARAGERMRLQPDLIHLRHHGYADDDAVARKTLRNLAIAQAQVDDLAGRPVDDGFAAQMAALNLGRAQLAAGRAQDAVDTFEVVREMRTGTPSWASATALLAQVLLDDGTHPEAAMHLTEELVGTGMIERQFADWLRAQALARTGRRGTAVKLLRNVHELVDPVNNRPSMDRVLIARALFAGAEGLLEESGEAIVQAVLGYGAHRDRLRLMLKIWQGRERALAERIARTPGPLWAGVAATLGGLGDPSLDAAAQELVARVADLTRDHAELHAPALPSASGSA